MIRAVVVMVVVVVVPIAGHEQLRLVLVGGRVGRRRLHRLRQSGEVELVRVPLSVHLRHDVLVVVVAQRAAQFVVVHVRLVFSLAPPSGHLVGVDHLELSVRPLPLDAVRVDAVREQLQQELPQLDLTAACKHNRRLADKVRTDAARSVRRAPAPPSPSEYKRKASGIQKTALFRTSILRT